MCPSGANAGDLEALREVADCLLSTETDTLIRERLPSGASYAAVRQEAAAQRIGVRAGLLASPNNILGIEYLKALQKLGSTMQALTIARCGTPHDGEATGAFASASALRAMLSAGHEPWRYMPEAAAAILKEEIRLGRGPVSLISCETAILSKLRSMDEAAYAQLPDATEGLHRRLMRFAKTETSVAAVAERTKTKRYALSRIRRMILCAYLGIEGKDTLIKPQYLRVLALGSRGRELLREISETSTLPVVTKPATAKKLPEQALAMFRQEAAATDLYVLAYPNPAERFGGREWTESPAVMC